MNGLFLFAACLSLSFWPSFGLYSSTDDVVQLTSSTFNEVLRSDSIWFVEFYAPWCGHCKNLAPEWKRAATILKGVVKVAVVNAQEEQALAGEYGVKGYPTILIFGQKKSGPITYASGRTYRDIVNEGLKQVKTLIDSKMDSKSSNEERSGNDVIELTDNNFEDLVINSDEPWLVEFFAPWCGHCKSLKPHWEHAATELKGSMKVGAVDATVHNALSQKYGIRGFPTIKYFPAGPKSGDPIEYDGGRTSDDIVRWAHDKVDSSLPAPDVIEVVSEELFKEACTMHPICIVSVMPTLYDCQSNCRRDYIELVKKFADVHKKQKWGWVWLEALQQPDLERKFDVGGSGYPAMLAIHSGKMKRTTLRGAFSEDGIHEFIRSLLFADPKMPLFPIDIMPSIVATEPWNGEDAPPIMEEELDLSDLGIKLEL